MSNQTERIEYDIGDKFISNYGEGPLEATITRIQDGVAYMDSQTLHGKRETEISLPVKFLGRRSCGWKRISKGGGGLLSRDEAEQATEAIAKRLFSDDRRTRHVVSVLDVSGEVVETWGRDQFKAAVRTTLDQLGRISPKEPQQ